MLLPRAGVLACIGHIARGVSDRRRQGSTIRLRLFSYEARRPSRRIRAVVLRAHDSTRRCSQNLLRRVENTLVRCLTSTVRPSTITRFGSVLNHYTEDRWWVTSAAKCHFSWVCVQ